MNQKIKDEAREKIAGKLYEASWCWSKELKHENWSDVPEEARTYWYSKADQILSLSGEKWHIGVIEDGS